MTAFRHCTVAACLLAALIAGGCTTARMALPPDLPASASALPVEGRKTFSFDESFQFGPHRVESVRRGWTRKTRWNIFGFESGKARQTYEFTLRALEGEPWTAHCATGLRWKEMEFDNFLDTGGTLEWRLSSDTAFACTFEGGKDAGTWKLVMDQGSGDMVLNGILTNGKTVISIEGTRKLAGTPIPLGESSGFVFRASEGVVGAVEVINNGAVWIAAESPEELRNALACASGSLLLYRALE